MHQRTMEVAAKAEPSSGLHRFPQVLHIIRRQRRPVQHVGPDPQRRPQRLLAPPLGNTAMIARTQHIRHGTSSKTSGRVKCGYSSKPAEKLSSSPDSSFPMKPGMSRVAASTSIMAAAPPR